MQTTPEEYTECAEFAHELNELLAFTKLAPLLDREVDHARLCGIGVWFWRCGHNELAASCYRRSLEIHPEAVTYFNLAVCLDDQASRFTENTGVVGEFRCNLVEAAVSALRAACDLYGSVEERASAEELLRANGKSHLVERVRNQSFTQLSSAPAPNRFGEY
jgi:hypothetical protein